MMIKNLMSKSLNVYLFSLLVGLPFYKVFFIIYVKLFKPLILSGETLFYSIPLIVDEMLSGLYLSFPFFLSVLVLFSSLKNKKKTWLIGMIPFLILSLMNGFLDMFWVLAFSGVGFLIGLVMLKMKK